MKHYIFILSLFFFTNCDKADDAQPSVELLYTKAIEDAKVPTLAKVDENLFPINSSNKKLSWKKINGEDHVLMLSWKKTKEPYSNFVNTTYNTAKKYIWVTPSPDLKERMLNETPSQLRLQQLLGLPPNVQYNYFIEMWVKPEDLFRPCPDMEITDTKCELDFPANTPASHIQWINETKTERYSSANLYEKYPYSALGYTYDWSFPNGKTVGLSEYVIDKGVSVYIKQVYTTEAYFDN